MKYKVLHPFKNKSAKQKHEIDPELKVEYPSDKPDAIADTEAEIKTLKKALQSGMDNQRQVQAENTNPHFHFTVYFQDEAQKNEFLQKANLKDLTAGQFINGLEFAKRLNIPIAKKEMKIPGKFRSFEI